MSFRKNEHLVLSPKKGVSYKLWSLPTGTFAKREGLKISGNVVNSFQILEQTPSVVYAETDRGYVFHLDSSLEAIVV